MHSPVGAVAGPRRGVRAGCGRISLRETGVQQCPRFRGSAGTQGHVHFLASRSGLPPAEASPQTVTGDLLFPVR
jgi:hypothetical protein